MAVVKRKFVSVISDPIMLASLFILPFLVLSVQSQVTIVNEKNETCYVGSKWKFVSFLFETELPS